MGCVYVRKDSRWLWIKYYSDGVPHHESARTGSREEAKRLLKLREGDIAKGVPVTPKTGRIRFDDAVRDVLLDYKTNGKRSLPHVERRVRLHLRPFFGGRRMASISATTIREFIAARQEASASNAEINRELAILKRAYSLALQSGVLHVKPYIPGLRESNARQGFFEADQFDSVCRHLPPGLADMVLFAYDTGWRIGEIRQLEWRHVDFGARTVRLDAGTTKNGEGRYISMTSCVESLLNRRNDETARLRKMGQITAWVFHRDGVRVCDFRGAWLAACAAAGQAGKLVHDLRRTAIRNMMRVGITERVAMRISGHKTRAVFDRYNIVSDSDLKDAARRLDEAEQPIPSHNVQS